MQPATKSKCTLPFNSYLMILMLTITSVTAGKTAGPVPVPWHVYEKAKFKRDVMSCFSSFLGNTAGEHRVLFMHPSNY